MIGRVLRTGLLGRARARILGLSPKGEHPSRSKASEYLFASAIYFGMAVAFAVAGTVFGAVFFLLLAVVGYGFALDEAEK